MKTLKCSAAHEALLSLAAEYLHIKETSSIQNTASFSSVF